MQVAMKAEMITKRLVLWCPCIKSTLSRISMSLIKRLMQLKMQGNMIPLGIEEQDM